MTKVRNKGIITIGIFFIVMCVSLCINTLTVRAIGKDEIEPNNDKQNANLINMGDTVYGAAIFRTYYDYDDDWFKIVAPISGTVEVSLKEYKDSSSDYCTAIKIYDDYGNELGAAYDSAETNAIGKATFGVVSGKTYYFMVSGEEYHFSLKYYIGKTNIKKGISKKNAFNIKWDKKAKTSFYQVRYTPKSVFEDYNWNKATDIKVSNKKNQITINNLKKKKSYYVQVRVARTIEGITYYSGWSKKKVINTK